ncbi:hypothetical protein PSHT_06444 [Puccinia striiformis]|uniref:Uncharacterized protein n=1 Tax=Puccinia striiformis TaxID=27350 RepID=A0A2S4W6L0_9BASI|nr:hypothetical protein PSHT_06444 [Puccinia striiformis]
MNSFSSGSKSPLQDDQQRHHNHQQKHPKPLDRLGKRQRSISPLNNRLSRCKRTALVQHHLQTTLTLTQKEEHQSSQLSPTFNAAVESMNERATRLGLENAYPGDVEMDFCSHSDGEEVDDQDQQTNYAQVPPPIQTQPTTSATLLPLHKPHPIAYQQHLALISSSNRSKKLGHSNRLLSPQKLHPRS